MVRVTMIVVVVLHSFVVPVVDVAGWWLSV